MCEPERGRLMTKTAPKPVLIKRNAVIYATNLRAARNSCKFFANTREDNTNWQLVEGCDPCCFLLADATRGEHLPPSRPRRSFLSGKEPPQPRATRRESRRHAKLHWTDRASRKKDHPRSPGADRKGIEDQSSRPLPRRVEIKPVLSGTLLHAISNFVVNLIVNFVDPIFDGGFRRS
jgi:hypothetical protein